jgi:hypothetical protein
MTRVAMSSAGASSAISSRSLGAVSYPELAPYPRTTLPLARREPPDGAPQLVCRVEHAGSALQQEAPGVGQRDLVRRAPQQLDAELAFEQAHLPAEGRLGDVQALGRAREAALGGHGDEVAQPAQVGHGLDASRGAMRGELALN